MTWNWEQENWPNFRYNESQLRSFEDEFLKESGGLCCAQGSERAHAIIFRLGMSLWMNLE